MALSRLSLVSWACHTVTWEEFAQAIHLILNGFGKGIDVDFKSRNLFGVGHSMGAAAIVLSRTMYPSVQWSSVILVEPMYISPDNLQKTSMTLAGGANKRRDVWPSRDGAYKQFRERSFKSWDPRLVNIHARYGLRELPTLIHSDKAQGVTLKCTKVQEAATYAENHGRMKSQRFLPTFCKEVPTHVIFGAIGDVNPVENSEFIKEVAGHRPGFRTTSVIEDAGHLTVQENPTAVAKMVWKILRDAQVVSSKL